MARDTNGTYTLPLADVVAGTVVSSAWANTTMNDLRVELSDSLSRSGKGGMNAPFKFFDGVVGAPGLAFTNEPSSGLYRAGNGDLRYAIVGADVLRLQAGGVSVTGTLSSTGAITQGGATLAATYAPLAGVTGAWSVGGGASVTGNTVVHGDGSSIYLQNSTPAWVGLLTNTNNWIGSGSKTALSVVSMGSISFHAGGASDIHATISTTGVTIPGTLGVTGVLSAGPDVRMGDGANARWRVTTDGTNVYANAYDSAMSGTKILSFQTNGGAATFGGTVGVTGNLSEAGSRVWTAATLRLRSGAVTLGGSGTSTFAVTGLPLGAPVVVSGATATGIIRGTNNGDGTVTITSSVGAADSGNWTAWLAYW